jgi:hypothetical protein
MARSLLGGIRNSVLVTVFIAALSVTLAGAISSSAFAQEKHVSPAAERMVDKNKMGPYRALAQLAYASYQKGDHATASELCQILERVWDKSEDYGGDVALSETHPDLFKQIDKAMDGFITPLMNYAKTPPNPANVKTAYAVYLEKLKLAD